LNEEVKVIRHQDERSHTPAKSDDRLAEEVDESLAISIVVEDRTSFVPP